MGTIQTRTPWPSRIANAMVKRALILGSAKTLRDDLDRALDLSEFDIVIAAKGAGFVWTGRLDAWVTLHPDRLEKRDLKRRLKVGPMPDRIYAHRKDKHVSHVAEYKWSDQKTTGSSGHFALKVAIDEYGCDRCVLCGVPIEKSLGRIEAIGHTIDHWSGSRAFRDGWTQSLHHYKEFTRSMSGWTRQLLGEPTTEWLES